ncbi:phage tail assembly chaperone G [Priestia megaterium]|uniref:phage tail assembly chaperone G n=1 Tax=Priestia megaterium TaxID=1404 RepID=UPI00406BBA94
MANLKRNVIELVKEVTADGEVITEKFLTPPFIPLSVVYQAMDLVEEAQKGETAEREMFDRMIDFVVNDIYGKKFTKDELVNGLHAPDAVEVINDQVLFVSQGRQSDETKKFLENKR